MFNFFKRNTLKEMQSHRDQAERLGIQYLEALAVKGTLSRAMLMHVAKALNAHPDELIEMIPDRRRPARHAKAMDGLRKANLIGDRRSFADFERHDD
ncbi:hypothetical protein ACQR2B_06480 [Bradyrhizobium oligotrophicum]|uniref:hypothetical protein n=1 Tax=Bradyrhizobium TaxID=374 RepID=UPI003EBEFB8E